MRWQHPERGPLGPLSFIPFAEETGLIDEIGQHVLETACEEAASLDRAASAPRAAPAISVNVAPRQLLDPDCPTGSESLLDRCGLEPRPPDPRDHRRRAHEGPGRGNDRAPAPERARCAPRGRRLRHRLLVARLPPAVPDRPAEDRRVVRERHPQPVRARSSSRPSSRSRTRSVWCPSPRASRAQAQVDALAACGCDLAQGFHLGRPVDAADRPATCDHPAAGGADTGRSRGHRGRVDSAHGGTRHSTPSFRHASLDAAARPDGPDAAGRRAGVLGRAAARPDRVDTDLAALRAPRRLVPRDLVSRPCSGASTTTAGGSGRASPCRSFGITAVMYAIGWGPMLAIGLDLRRGREHPARRVRAPSRPADRAECCRD